MGREGDFAWFTTLDGIVAQGVGGGGGGAGSSAQAARGGALAEKARDSPEPEKALFVLSGPFQNRKLTQNLTCDLLTLHLKFNSTVLSQS